MVFFTVIIIIIPIPMCYMHVCGVSALFWDCLGALNKMVLFEYGMHQTEFLSVVCAVCFKVVIMQ